ncbi:MAG: methylmalonyl-CoA mutase, partial [Actinobacteria bacterium]|nr:methylmalonyl-CoA mutase [Actinomycetota bacterium]
EKIEVMGGAVTAIENGFQKREIENSAYKISQEIDKRERIVVGVNDFLTENDVAPILHKLDPKVGNEQRVRLAEHRAQRNNNQVTSALAEISKVAGSTENVMPALKAAIKVGATVGEICDALRAVWGVYRSSEAF